MGATLKTAEIVGKKLEAGLDALRSSYAERISKTEDQFGDPRSFDLSELEKVPDVAQSPVERYNPPRGRPKTLDPLLNQATADKLTGYAEKGRDQGGLEWYNMEPLRKQFVDELGPVEGAERFERYIDIVAATSPRSKVDMNIRRSSYLYGRDVQGLPISSLKNPDLPKGYGHLAHETQNHLLKDLESGGHFSSLNRPKTSSFAENLKGNQTPMTIDTHNFAAITGELKNKKSPSNTQYKYLEEFQAGLADKIGLTPAQWQASVWVGAGTGVADVRPFMEVFDDVVARTAKRDEKSKPQVVTDFIRGKAPLYEMAGGAVLGAGMMMAPQEADASVAPGVLKAVSGIIGRYGENATKDDASRAIVEAFGELRAQHVGSGKGAAVYDKRNIAGGGQGDGIEPGVVYSMPGEYSQELNKLGISTPDLLETTDSTAFHQAISGSKQDSPYGASVYVYDKDEYDGMRKFITPDGKAGYALKGDDIVSVFNTADSPHKAVAYPFLLHAVEQGGKRLDAFDTVLPTVYSRMGFKTVAKNAWDDKYMPGGWDKGQFNRWNQGEPDVDYMGYSPGPASVAPENRGMYADTPERAQLLQAGNGDVTALQRGRATPEMLAATAVGATATAATAAAFAPSDYMDKTIPTPRELAATETARHNFQSISAHAREASTALQGLHERRQAKQGVWQKLRAELSDGLTSGADLALEALESLDMPMKGVLGLTGVAGQLAAGSSMDQALQYGANQVNQPIEQTSYNLGGATTDALAQTPFAPIAPAAGAAIHAGIQLGGL